MTFVVVAVWVGALLAVAALVICAAADTGYPTVTWKAARTRCHATSEENTRCELPAGHVTLHAATPMFRPVEVWSESKWWGGPLDDAELVSAVRLLREHDRRNRP